ncbi:MAG: M3 family metallopeptidase [Alphaproteobacteria bacterium]|nr:M3 family metallopeptidase [Alphaproteobacteria bacterium]
MTADSQNFNATASSNPLINPPALPYGAFAFDKVELEHLAPALEYALAEAQKEIDAIKNNPEAPSFENTIEALEFSGEALGRVLTVFGVLGSNNSSDEIRALEPEFDAKTSAFGSAVSMDDVLFARIKAVYDAKDTLGLDPEQMMLLEKTYKSRVRSGALLDDAGKARMKEINSELARLTTTYKQNTLRHSGSYERITTLEELPGVPERTLKVLKAAAENAVKAAEKNRDRTQIAFETMETIDPRSFKTPQIASDLVATARRAAEAAQKHFLERQAALDGKYLIRLQPPPTEILVYCENRDLRKELSEASSKIGDVAPYDNSQITLDIVKLRHEKAQLLGFENHAAFILADRMAGSQQTVMDFLHKNLAAYKPEGEAYFNSVKEYAAKQGHTDFQPWDFGFYSKKLQKELFDFDTEKLRPYFELSRVFDGFRAHIEKLFGVEMVEATDKYPVYRDDAKVYEVRDQQTGETRALFYADYFAEAGVKRGGAWMNNLRDAGLDKNGNQQIPIVTNSCNYQKPPEGEPCLLSMDDVRTLYHEGGHGFHGALGRGKYPSLTGTNVKWDFVELPSQLQENWMSEKEVLDTFAVHYKEDTAFPAEYLAKLEEMKHYGSAYFGLRQTALGLTDMLWHTQDPADIASVDQIEDQVHALTSFWPERTSTMSTNFGHLFSDPVGYSSGYYSYKWAEVLEADVFEEFKKNGLYHPETAKRLRETIYEQGGTAEPMDIFKAMMGREPDTGACCAAKG